MKAYGWMGWLGSAALYGGAWAIPASRAFASSWEWPALVVGYALMTVLLIGWMEKSAKASPMRFVAAVNGATAVKLLSSVALVTIYLVAGGLHRVPFAMGLFAAFAWNTARFVWVSQTFSRPQNTTDRLDSAP
jgi:hypothetical protein